jgi:hypothetical protein
LLRARQPRFEDVSRRVTRREIPQILLLRANSLNADRFDALAEVLKRRGYRFVSVDQAMRHTLKVLVAAALAREYGFTDVGGKTPRPLTLADV